MSVGVEVRLEGVSRRYGVDAARNLSALDDVTLEVAPRAVVAVTGPSGSGKSTLLHVIGAMDRPDEGAVRVDGREVTELSAADQAAYRRAIGFVFQRFHLLPALSVIDNVAAPVLPYRTLFDKWKRASELLEAVGLDGRGHDLPSQLSGGEQQRVAIARALINEPGLLLADEPTGNIDSETSLEIMELLLNLRAQRGMTVIVATHDPLIAARCDRMVRLEDGRVVEDITVRPAEPEETLERIKRFGPGS